MLSKRKNLSNGIFVNLLDKKSRLDKHLSWWIDQLFNNHIWQEQFIGQFCCPFQKSPVKKVDANGGIEDDFLLRQIPPARIFGIPQRACRESRLPEPEKLTVRSPPAKAAF